MANLDNLASPHPRIKGWCSATSIASSMCNTLSFIRSPCQKGKKNPPFTEEGCNEFGCRLGAIREVKMYSFPPLPGQHSGSSWTDYCRCRICRLVYGWGGRIDWLWIDLLILLILVLGRYALQAMKHVEPQVKQVFQSLPKSVRQLFFFW